MSGNKNETMSHIVYKRRNDNVDKFIRLKEYRNDTKINLESSLRIKNMGAYGTFTI